MLFRSFNNGRDPLIVLSPAAVSHLRLDINTVGERPHATAYRHRFAMLPIGLSAHC